MPKQIFIKPAPGRVVRDPVTMEPLPAAGAWKPHDTYWRRRLTDKDVTKAKPKSEEKAGTRNEDKG